MAVPDNAEDSHADRTYLQSVVLKYESRRTECGDWGWRLNIKVLEHVPKHEGYQLERRVRRNGQSGKHSLPFYYGHALSNPGLAPSAFRLVSYYIIT